MRQFAEDEIVLPSGPFAGSRFRCHRQPYTGLWFDQVDSGQFSRFVATGPTQSGKTIACFVIPLLYHLFEQGETVICGLPDMDMATDKWREDLLPIIERSKYRDQLPKQGSGSRGGLVQSLQFRNGATLKFMSGGGGDKSRAAFTSRVVVITETDGMDEPGRNSRESDKISQLIARTRALAIAAASTWNARSAPRLVERGRNIREAPAVTSSYPARYATLG
ncbi:MAG: phage terminase large subunit family protein [Pirellulaceae bacterium]